MQVAAVTAESCDAVEGVANMAVAMKYAQPTQVQQLHGMHTFSLHTLSLLFDIVGGMDYAALSTMMDKMTWRMMHLMPCLGTSTLGKASAPSASALVNGQYQQSCGR